MSAPIPHLFVTPLTNTMLLVCLLLPGIAFAAVPVDGAYLIEAPGSYPYVIIEQGSVKNASGYLVNPVCVDGLIQAPALLTDLHAFFEGYPVNRVIDRGDGHYLLTTNIEFPEDDRFRKIGAGSMYAVYAELEFTSTTEGIFTLRAATTFFSGAAMGTSTCLARESWPLQRVNS